MVVLFGMVLRAAWLVYALRTPVGAGDSQFYLQTAQRLADGQGYVGATGQATALWPPGYSFVLAIPIWLVGNTFLPGTVITAGAVLNLLLGTATIAIVGMIGRRLLGPVTAIGAALLVAMFPSLIMFTAALLSETLFTFLATSVVAVLVWHPWGTSAAGFELPTSRTFVTAGLIAGLAVLVRPTFIPSLLLVPVAILITSRDMRRTFPLSAAFLVPIVVIVAPWTIRNAVVMDAFVPVSTNTGYNLCIGNNPDATGAYIPSEYCFGDLPTDDTTIAEVERDRLTTQRAKDWIIANPGAQFRLVPLRTLYLLLNDSSAVPAMNSYGNDPWMTIKEVQIWSWVSDVYFFGVATLGLLGVFFWSTNGDRRKLVLALVMAGALFAVWPFFGDARFKVPMMPLLALFAVVPIQLMYRSTRGPNMPSQIDPPIRTLFDPLRRTNWEEPESEAESNTV